MNASLRSDNPVPTRYMCGVIEGFYGRPWRDDERLQMIRQLHDTGLNTYIYAPKFDLIHRWNWRQSDSTETRRHLGKLCDLGRSLDIAVILSLSPGLSIHSGEIELLVDRFSQLAALHPAGLALLMDDIPYDRADPRFHSRLAQTLTDRLPQDLFLMFCPTAYSEWHLKHWSGARAYLETIGRELPGQWHVFWTGTTIISRTMSAGDLAGVQSLIQRKPLIWDNFSADDYVPAHSVFPGPLTGRSADLPSATTGLLLNPSEVFTASRAAMYSLADWFRSPLEYIEEKAFDKAVRALTPLEPMQQVLHDVMGYFYTPFDVSPAWRHRLDTALETLRNPITHPGLPDQLDRIRQRLRNEQNINDLGEIWIDLYPFTRTLLGDLDYLIEACRKRAGGRSLEESLPPRDPRWSTPVSDWLHRL
ncbi:MAG TPA: beta-N-acetylglucosaminidase domain-containing protein [bacterium]|nr:beta-N-acetylglucosaminidase domain-containing protein [bacterium]